MGWEKGLREAPKPLWFDLARYFIESQSMCPSVNYDSVVQNILLLSSSVASIVGAIVTTVYVVLTYASLRTSQEMVRVTKEQMRAQGRPYIQVLAKTRPGSQILQLSISNAGKSAAFDLMLRMKPDFRQFHDPDKKPLQESPLFSDVIQMFPPSMELLFDLGVGYQFFQGEANDRISPPRFSVTASYRDASEEYIETTEIDLHIFHYTTASTYGELAELKGIREGITNIHASTRDLFRAYQESAEDLKKEEHKRAWKLR